MKRAIVVCGSCIVLMATGCWKSQSPSTSGGQAGDHTVVVYSSADKEFAELIFRAYEQKTGVKVLPLYDTEETKTAGLTSRLVAEKDPDARVRRARQERRLGELAEQAGDLPAAILHYRAALASHAGVGVKRRLTRLAPPGPASASPEATAGPAPTCPASGRGPRARVPRPRGFAPSSPAGTSPADSTRLWAARERSCVSGHSARPHPP
jgi:hypothetical protein